MIRVVAGMERTARIVAAALVALALAPAAGADRQKDPGLREVIAAAIKSTACFEDKYDDVVWYALMQPRVEMRLRAQPADLRLGDDLKKASERILHAVHCESSKHAMLRDRPQLVLAVIDVESAFDPFAVSSAGAVGLICIEIWGYSDAEAPPAAAQPEWRAGETNQPDQYSGPARDFTGSETRP